MHPYFCFPSAFMCISHTLLTPLRLFKYQFRRVLAVRLIGVSLMVLTQVTLAQTESAPSVPASGTPTVVMQDVLSSEVSQFLSTYRMGTGDVISIRVFGEPDLSISNVRLSEVGTVFLPTLGETKVGGLTLTEVERAVADRLRGRILVNPRVSVSVEQYRPFFINGMVRSPGAYPYQPGLTVRKASSLAGGLHERASLRKIFVIRADDPSQKQERIGIDSVVFPGDIVTIEESFF